MRQWHRDALDCTKGTLSSSFLTIRPSSHKTHKIARHAHKSRNCMQLTQHTRLHTIARAWSELAWLKCNIGYDCVIAWVVVLVVVRVNCQITLHEILRDHLLRVKSFLFAFNVPLYPALYVRPSIHLSTSTFLNESHYQGYGVIQYPALYVRPSIYYLLLHFWT